MNMTDRELMQQALGALELGYDSAKAEADQYHAAMAGYRQQRHAQMDADVQKIAAAITALRAALAEPVQEPVAWINWSALTGERRLGWGCESEIASEPLYTAPPPRQWQGLTDEEIEKGRDQTFSINNPYCPCDSKTMRKAVRWAEAKLREKNA